ncbi:MAG: hypothetical protein ABSC94_32050, partial [Polyangiaceae bacterium]
PDEHSSGIPKLRELHAQMDRAVLDTYGWTDIKPVYDFREQLDESIRLTWDDETRDEILARLLELNRVMAEREVKSIIPRASAKGGKRSRKGSDAIETSSAQQMLTLSAPADDEG